MRLFLSSYRFGAEPQQLLSMVDEPRRVAVIAAAADAWPPSARESAMVSDAAALRSVGCRPEEVDLRRFIGAPEALAARMADFDMLWVRGGNTFVLRAQLARSGADTVIADLLDRDALVYAGYSAGACVMTPSLVGLDESDDPGEVFPTCGVEPMWTGLGLVDFAIVPHVGSVLATPAATERTVAALRCAGMDYRTLTDEQAILVDGQRVELV